MELPTQPSFSLGILLFVLGICIGSFLNVVALRSLAEESFFLGSSKCPRCQHKLSPFDNIPLISYLVLGGKCRYCRTSIHWQYPLVEFITGVLFVAIPFAFLDFKKLPYFNWQLGRLHDQNLINNGLMSESTLIWLYIAGALYLACTLVAISITDFREKLIPHEITYPAMIVGILFSAFVRQDVLGAMAGIGASYILFDFIAFYGLKVYVAMHGGMDDEPIRTRRLRRRLRPRARRKLNRILRWRLDLATIERKQEDQEPLEVMGGGDAVLSAVMSAFLGWQLLICALLIGFVLGTIMGLGLLFREMAKAKLLHKLGKSCAIWSAAFATAFGAFGFLLAKLIGTANDANPLSSAATFAILGALCGLLIGTVNVGTKVSKPYPFGPALAAGGMWAIFFLPNWLY